MWKIAKDDVRNLERCSTVERALCTGLGRRRILTRPGIRVPLLPQGLTDLVHGDDCFIVGRQKGREHAEDLLQAVYELNKVVTLGRGPSHSQAVTFLGRTQTLRKRGIEYEQDTQHVPRSLKALGLTGARCVAIPGTDDVGGNKVSELSKLRRTANWHDPQKKLKRRRIPRSVKN